MEKSREEPNEESQAFQMFLFWVLSFLTRPPIAQILDIKEVVIIIILKSSRNDKITFWFRFSLL